MLARIKAILRRSDCAEVVGGSFAGHRLSFSRWVLDTDRRTLTNADGAEVALHRRVSLLTVFLERPHFVLSREQLLDLTSGRAAQVFDRTIDNQIRRLRRKIEADTTKPTLIATIWGGGYSLAADEGDAVKRRPSVLLGLFPKSWRPVAGHAASGAGHHAGAWPSAVDR